MDQEQNKIFVYKLDDDPYWIKNKTRCLQRWNYSDKSSFRILTTFYEILLFTLGAETTSTKYVLHNVFCYT